MISSDIPESGEGGLAPIWLKPVRAIWINISDGRLRLGRIAAEHNAGSGQARHD